MRISFSTEQWVLIVNIFVGMSSFLSFYCLQAVSFPSIAYEHCIGLHLQKLFDVLDFLKVPRRKLVSRHVKIHTKPLSEYIDNWDEVYSTLNGTQYESFLTSDYMIWHHASPHFLCRCRYSPFVCVLFFCSCLALTCLAKILMRGRRSAMAAFEFLW